eukprot:CAMPEP_0194764496 /NCGR_PEP_ID=MMETSP0323_2-20130528/23076_1 /TAXON_ID=2866 ORGANISM="Crypthecodinium cohnii, Strain Seligo" /NCGR_SAMPLE_ID=MMETSP0323_2 /ASSEMBLY_ACC=CAM_ASM_000346 /LENGTH=54 /DNA_ID=CAMNT_0039691791 /DNA_START=164 /DNA_END=325 /DNA_ORIENTATION=-
MSACGPIATIEIETPRQQKTKGKKVKEPPGSTKLRQQQTTQACMPCMRVVARMN